MPIVSKSRFKVAYLSSLLVTVSAFSGLAQADESAQQALLDQLVNMETLQASFTQEVTDEQGNLVQQFQGSLVLARPDLLYWQTEAPDETLLVADGRSVYYYNTFVEQVTIYDQDAAGGQSPLLLLLNSEQADWSGYEVTQDDMTFALEPTQMDGQQQALQLSFAEQGVIDKIVLDDGQGQVNTIQLSEQVVNADVDQVIFSFSVPEGVDVDDQREQQHSGY